MDDLQPPRAHLRLMKTWQRAVFPFVLLLMAALPMRGAGVPCAFQTNVSTDVATEIPLVTDKDGNPSTTFVERTAAAILKAEPDELPGCLKGLRGRQTDAHIKIGQISTVLAPVAKKDPKTEEDQKTIQDLTKQIESYRAIESFIARMVAEKDAWALSLDFYAAVIFSNLYRDPASNQGYFSTSKPYLLLEWRQLLQDEWKLYVWGELALRTSSFQTQTVQNPQDNTLQPIDSFTAEAGLEGRMPDIISPTSQYIRLNWVAGWGKAGFSQADEGPGLAPHQNDDFEWRGRAGFRFRELEPLWQGSFAELAYFRDPTFIQRSRFLARARVVVSPQVGEGRGLGAFVEGSLNTPYSPGRSEIRLMIGVRLDTLAILRAIVGAGPHG